MDIVPLGPTWVVKNDSCERTPEGLLLSKDCVRDSRIAYGTDGDTPLTERVLSTEKEPVRLIRRSSFTDGLLGRRNDHDCFSLLLSLSIFKEEEGDEGWLRKLEISLSLSLQVEGMDSSSLMFHCLSTWMAVLWSVVNSNSICGPEPLILVEEKG